MTKEELLGKICYADAINECCSECGDTSCEKCELEMSILLDKYAEQIRADAIEEFAKLLKEKADEDTSRFNVYTFTCIDEIAEQLKEQKNDSSKVD